MKSVQTAAQPHQAFFGRPPTSSCQQRAPKSHQASGHRPPCWHPGRESPISLATCPPDSIPPVVFCTKPRGGVASLRRFIGPSTPRPSLFVLQMRIEVGRDGGKKEIGYQIRQVWFIWCSTPDPWPCSSRPVCSVNCQTVLCLSPRRHALRERICRWSAGEPCTLSLA